MSRIGETMGALIVGAAAAAGVIYTLDHDVENLPVTDESHRVTVPVETYEPKVSRTFGLMPCDVQSPRVPCIHVDDETPLVDVYAAGEPSDFCGFEPATGWAYCGHRAVWVDVVTESMLPACEDGVRLPCAEPEPEWVADPDGTDHPACVIVYVTNDDVAARCPDGYGYGDLS